MHCAQSHDLRNETGSAVAGFALVAPLLVCVFVVLIQISSVLAERATLAMATQEGVRVASTMDGSPAEGRSRAVQVLQGMGMELRTTVEFHAEHRGATRYVVCRGTTRKHISWLNRDLTFQAISRAVDEGAL